MDKILYSPKEGTTGFWGLRGFEERPNITLSCDNDSCEGECGEVCPSIQGKRWELEAYEKRVESCKSNKLEIVNPEVIVNTDTKYFIEHELKPGDIFDLPEETYLFYDNCINPKKAWIKPVPQPETKEDVWKEFRDNPEMCERLTRHGKLSQPEPEESQHEMFTELLKLFTEFGYKKVLQNFTIQRKKQ